jgi:hypothetical protein
MGKRSRKSQRVENIQTGGQEAPAIIFNSSLKIEGETSFRRPHIVKLSATDEHSGIFIERIYAKGGFVIVHYVDLRANAEKAVMMPPGEAAARAYALSKGSKYNVTEGLIEAALKASLAARAQTLQGDNPIFNQNKGAVDLEQEMREIAAEIEEARKNDPLLDEEMRAVERGESAERMRANATKVYDDNLKAMAAPSLYTPKT